MNHAKRKIKETSLVLYQNLSRGTFPNCDPKKVNPGHSSITDYGVGGESSWRQSSSSWNFGHQGTKEGRVSGFYIEANRAFEQQPESTCGIITAEYGRCCSQISDRAEKYCASGRFNDGHCTPEVFSREPRRMSLVERLYWGSQPDQVQCWARPVLPGPKQKVLELIDVSKLSI